MMPIPVSEVLDIEMTAYTENKPPLQPGADFNPLFSNAITQIANRLHQSDPEHS